MRALVTGGAGFIGSNLCRRLLKLNYEVICLDNFYSGKYENIEELLPNEKFKLIEHDVREPFDIKCDIIFNLACPASPPFYQKGPIYTSETNYLGMSNVLKCALKYNAKVLQASTSEVYGNPDENHHPQKEDYWGNVNPNGIRSCYDEGKRIAEELCIDYNMQYGLRTYIVRIFNTYGPYMRIDDGRVVTNFISQALSNKDLTIYGTGMQTRSMQYIDDLIDGILLLVDSDYHYPVNIGNPTEYSVNEIADIILAEVNGASKKVFKDLPKDDPERRKPDITLARKILNWEPKIDFRSGLSKTTNYFKKYDSNA